MEIEDSQKCSLSDVVRRLRRYACVVDDADERIVAIITGQVVEKLEQQAIELIASTPTAPVMCVYMSDGWSSITQLHSRWKLGQHVTIDRSGRIRMEFCLERAFIRQLRPSGAENVRLLAKHPRGMTLGKCAGNFFTAAYDFAHTLGDVS